MEIGMLWFDDSPRSLKERVQQAADFYAEKYGEKPTLCLVHPAMLESGNGALNGIRLQGARAIMPDHFWIGVDESDGRERSPIGRPGSAASGSKAKAGKQPAAKKSTAKVVS